jgi:hypothetical protein
LKLTLVELSHRLAETSAIAAPEAVVAMAGWNGGN